MIRLQEKLKEFICTFVDVDINTLTSETDIRTEFSFDSLSLINLAAAIENEFDIEITENELNGIETVGDFMKLIDEKTNTN